MTITCQTNKSTVETRKIVLCNKIEEISRMASFLEEIGGEFHLSAEVSFNIHLAMEEAITNVIMYAYPQDEEHEIELSVCCTDKDLTFRITDSGKEFDPTLHPDADVTLSLEERPVGGLGIFLIRRIMDKVEYDRMGGMNVLTMVKNLN